MEVLIDMKLAIVVHPSYGVPHAAIFATSSAAPFLNVLLEMPAFTFFKIQNPPKKRNEAYM